MSASVMAGLPFRWSPRGAERALVYDELAWRVRDGVERMFGRGLPCPSDPGVRNLGQTRHKEMARATAPPRRIGDTYLQRRRRWPSRRLRGSRRRRFAVR